MMMIKDAVIQAAESGFILNGEFIGAEYSTWQTTPQKCIIYPCNNNLQAIDIDLSTLTIQDSEARDITPISSNDKAKVLSGVVTRQGFSGSYAGAVSPIHVISRYYRNSSESEMLNQDFSLSSDDFFIEVPAGEIWLIERVLPIIRQGNIQFRASDFGSIAGGLAVGVQLGVVVDGQEAFFEDLLWKQNIDLSLTMFDFDDKFKDGASVGRWTLSKDTGLGSIKLNAGDRQFFRVNDDLSPIDDFRIIARGRKIIL